MKATHLVLLVILAAGGLAIWQYVSGSQNSERFQSDLESMLRSRFEAEEPELKSAAQDLARRCGWTEGALTIEFVRDDRARSVPEAVSLPGVPGQQTRALEARGQLEGSILFFSHSFPFKARVTRTTTPHPHQQELQDAFRTLGH